MVRRDFVITTATFGDEIVEGSENTRSVVKVTHVPVSQRELMDSDDEMSLGDSDEEDEGEEDEGEEDEEDEEESEEEVAPKKGKKASKAAEAAADAEMEELDDDEDFEDEDELAQTCIASLIPGKVRSVAPQHERDSTADGVSLRGADRERQHEPDLCRGGRRHV